MMKLKRSELKEFLDEKVDLYNRPSFIDSDPVSIPHQFSSKGDIEISGFLAASIAWGNRKMILRNANRMMELLDRSPYDFVTGSTSTDIDSIGRFVHRTFSSDDMKYFLMALQNIYRNHGGLESIFIKNKTRESLQPAIHELHRIFFELPHSRKTERHISDPFKGSAAKKINMFLRWMVRKDERGVDFGIWNTIPASILSCPLDVHSGAVARKLGLLGRKQNDNRAVEELDLALRRLDPLDPVKYDFALFGLGIFERF